jgi:hypothetical protein
MHAPSLPGESQLQSTAGSIATYLRESLVTAQQPVVIIPWDRAATIWSGSEERGGVDASPSPTTSNEANGPNRGGPKVYGGARNATDSIITTGCQAALNRTQTGNRPWITIFVS